MNLGRIVCAIRGHSFGRWRSNPLTAINPAHRSRKCKRCGKVEAMPVRTRIAQKTQLREATAADTTQGKP